MKLSLIALLAGIALAGLLAVGSPSPAAAVPAQTSPAGSANNPDGTSGVPVNTVAPSVNRHGRVRVGTLLICRDGVWANDPTSFRVRWRRGRRLIHTGARYRVTRRDAGSRLRCFVAAANPQGLGVPALAGTVTVPGRVRRR